MTQKTSVPRSDSSQDESREEILAIAAPMLDEGGLEGLTIRRLSAESGFTPPAIYALFGDKAGLVNALIERSFRSLADRLEKIEPPADSRVFAKRMFRELVRFGREHPWHLRLLEQMERDQSKAIESVQRVRQVLRGPLVVMAETDRLRFGDAELIRQAFWIVMHGLVALPPMRPDVLWRDELADVVFEAMMTGLLGPGANDG